MENDKKSKRHTTDVAFTPSVMNVQDKLGSRVRMQKLSESGRWGRTFTSELAQFLETRRSVVDKGNKRSCERGYTKTKSGNQRSRCIY